jgi:RES domain-containing protein
MEGWRITRAKKLGEAFSGEGARLFGGRWNSQGIRMVYAAGTRSLAILEVLAHLTKAAPLNNYILYRIECDDSLVQILSDLPRGWNSEPPTSVSQSIGDAWMRSATHPVLSVPSAIVPEERNYLLNPAHSEFSRILIEKPVAYRIDPRLL